MKISFQLHVNSEMAYSRSFLLAHAQDIVGIIAILFFLVHVFDRVSLSIIVKCLFLFFFFFFFLLLLLCKILL